MNKYFDAFSLSTEETKKFILDLLFFYFSNKDDADSFYFDVRGNLIKIIAHKKVPEAAFGFIGIDDCKINFKKEDLIDHEISDCR